MEVFALTPDTLSEDRPYCIASAHINRLKKCKRYTFDVESYGLINVPGIEPPRPRRQFALCEQERGKFINYLWADVETGTLYRIGGQCVSSDRIKIVQQGVKSGRGATKARAVA